MDELFEIEKLSLYGVVHIAEFFWRESPVMVWNWSKETQKELVKFRCWVN